jgi:hypothetical protein
LRREKGEGRREKGEGRNSPVHEKEGKVEVEAKETRRTKSE